MESNKATLAPKKISIVTVQIVTWTSILLLSQGLILLISETFMLNNSKLLAYDSYWSTAAGAFILISLISVTSMSIHDQIYHLYIYCTTLALSIFCSVTASGGLIGSPFMVMYATLFTVSIIITDKSYAITFVGSIIFFMILLHFFVDKHYAPEFEKSTNEQYRIKFLLVILSNFATAIIAELVKIKSVNDSSLR